MYMEKEMGLQTVHSSSSIPIQLVLVPANLRMGPFSQPRATGLCFLRYTRETGTFYQPCISSNPVKLTAITRIMCKVILYNTKNLDIILKDLLCMYVYMCV